MNKWLTIIGMGEDGWEGLSNRARVTIKQAEVIIGSPRLSALLPKLKVELLEWPQPFSAVETLITPLRGRNTVVLASGDPSNFGTARKLRSFIPFHEMTIIPHVSAFAQAAARMGWSIPDCDCATIHGRPAAWFETLIQPDTKIILLTEDETSVAEVCRRLVARGFENSIVTVLENMSGPTERTTSFAANALPDAQWSPFNTLAIHCIASPNAKIYSRVGGLPDEAFIHDGQMTKREVRAATLAALAPAPDQLLWDIGAGCGSVAIEWMRSTRGVECCAIEPNAERRAMIAANMDHLGAPRLKVIEGTAPQALAGLAAPHAIFIGGGLSDAGVFEAAWAALKAGGNLVANVVTLEGERQLINLQEQYGGDLVRMDISNLTKVGDLRAMRPRMSVLQWRVQKPW
jgi:precorrin-6Y C5,15-methyltransferase (decarboxylating)